MTRSLDQLWDSVGRTESASNAIRTPLLMGVLNVTPDSFSDAGRYNGREAAVRHALALIEEGADIIDIGGESTRPPGRDYGQGSCEVSEEQELERVMPVVEAILAERPQATISIDTMKPAVARQAVRAGAAIINDVSAGGYDPAIWDVAAEADVPYILMHGHDPRNRVAADTIAYRDVVGEVYQFLHDRIALARAAGIRRVAGDVGIGFAKGAEESARLIREGRRFLELGVPMLVGASRKSFIGRILGGIPPEERLFGTLGAHLVAALNGAAIVRVHDVRASREFFTVVQHLTAQPSAGNHC